MTLRATIVSQPLLDDDDRIQMLQLHQRYFENVCPEVFLRDMAAKDRVIVLRDATDTITGFSTIRIVTLEVADLPCVFLFSGDTVVDEKHRQRGLLAGAFGHMMLRILDDYPETPAYWFLISKGYRTYRFLPLYFRRFFPCRETTTPPLYEQLVNAIATHLFADTFDATSGIVRHAGVGDRLAPALCTVPAGRRSDPHINFFVSRNPHYAQGDELACIADIDPDNFRPACTRLIKRTSVEWIDEEPLCTV